MESDALGLEPLSDAVEIDVDVWQGSMASAKDLLSRTNGELRSWAVVSALNGVGYLFPVARHWRVDLADRTDAPLPDELLENLWSFVRDAKANGLRVLMHCEAGISRSPTLACAWLIREHGWSAEKALGCVRRAGNSRANPNAGFWQRLRRYDARNSSEPPERPSSQVARSTTG